MTEAKKIAAGLTEAQREAFLRDTADLGWEPPMWIRAHDNRLVAYHENTFGNFLSWTPLGLAVRKVLETHHAS